MSELPIELIAIVIVIIIIPILVYLIRMWVLAYREKKGQEILSHNDVMEEANHPKSPPKIGETRVGLDSKEVTDVIFNIKNSIHTFGSDDVTTILQQIKRARTKYDLAEIISVLLDSYSISIMDILNKTLTSSQRKLFAQWQENLPTYVKK